jgi:hypothetical protein
LARGTRTRLGHDDPFPHPPPFPPHVPLHACGLPPPPPSCAGPPPPETHNGGAHAQQPSEPLVLAFVWGGGGWYRGFVPHEPPSNLPPLPNQPLRTSAHLRAASASAARLRCTSCNAQRHNASTQACKNTTSLSEGGGQAEIAREHVRVRCSNRRSTGAAGAGAHEAHAQTSTVHVAEGGIRHGAESGCVRGW